MLKKAKSKAVFKVIGFALFCISLIYLFKVFNEMDVVPTDVFLQSDHLMLTVLACGLSYGVVLVIGALIWSSWVLQLDSESKNKRQSRFKLMAIYFMTGIQKYIPGNFFQLVGRNLMGAQHGFKHKSLIYASLLEILLAVFAGALVVIFLMPFYGEKLDTIIVQYRSELIIFAMVVLISVTAVILLSLKNKANISSIYSSLNLKSNASLYFVSVLLFLVTFAILGWYNLFLFNQMFDTSLNIKMFGVITFGFTISWLIGFLIPGAPGGVGVREAVFLLTLSGIFVQQELLLVAIAVRLIGLAVEVLMFVLGWLYLTFLEKPVIDSSSN